MTFCNICGKPKLSSDLPVSIELWKTCSCDDSIENAGLNAAIEYMTRKRANKDSGQ